MIPIITDYKPAPNHLLEATNCYCKGIAATDVFGEGTVMIKLQLVVNAKM